MFVSFFMEDGSANQLPEIIIKNKQGYCNSFDVLIFWEHLSNSQSQTNTKQQNIYKTLSTFI